jgi:hypothetical protein
MGGRAGGASGAAGGAGGSSTGGAGGGGATLPACSSTTSSSTPLSASAFCMNLIATCTGVTGYTPGAYATQSGCETAYAASSMKMCQSYHLCGNAFGKADALKMAHCPHAVQMGGACM